MSKDTTSNGDAKQSAGKGDTTGNQQQAYDQGGHQGLAGHAGQHSGGMGGEHGGDLHDVGSAQSGMTGGSGMGGNDRNRQADERLERDAGSGSDGGADGAAAGRDDTEIQQSAQREGMGHHQHSGRGNEQALDAARDVDDVGTHQRGAGQQRQS